MSSLSRGSSSTSLFSGVSGCWGFILTAFWGVGAFALAAGSFLGLPLFLGAGAAVACSCVFASSGVFGSCIIVFSTGAVVLLEQVLLLFLL